MTTDTDKIEDLAELIMWLDGQAIQERNQRKPTDLDDWRENQARWLNEHAENLRSLSAELTELRHMCDAISSACLTSQRLLRPTSNPDWRDGIDGAALLRGSRSVQLVYIDVRARDAAFKIIHALLAERGIK